VVLTIPRNKFGGITESIGYVRLRSSRDSIFDDLLCRVTCIWRKRSGRCCTPGRRRRRHRTSRRRCGKPSGELLLWKGFLGARGTGTPALLRRGAVWNVCPPWSKGGNSTRPCTPPAPALDVRCQVWVKVSPMGRGREPKGFEGEGGFSSVTSIEGRVAEKLLINMKLVRPKFVE